MFKNFTVTVYYKWASNYNSFGDNGSIVSSFLAEGTWGHLPPKLNFTKRELSCPNFLGRAKQLSSTGWAHKQIDTPIVRDFSMGYPYPAFGEGIGYNYPSSYYVDQTAGGDVPLIDKLLIRQPVKPIQGSAGIPFYYKNKDGTVPNLPENFALNPDETIFENKKDYQEWLDGWLNKTASPVYYPNAPNDPEYAIPQKPLSERKIPTLFATKNDWLMFRNKAGGHGRSLCGGHAQCGVQFSLVNDPDQIINCSSSRTDTIKGQPPQSISGTAVVKQIPVVLLNYIDFFSKPGGAGIGYTRSAKKNESGKILIDKFGNINFEDWVNNFPTDEYHYQELRQFMGGWNPNNDELIGFPFFNKKQKICSQFLEYVKTIPLPQVWTLLPTNADRGDGLPYEDATQDFFPETDAWGWDRKHDTTFEETDTSLSWSAEAISSQSYEGFNGNFEMKCTVKWEWEDL